MMQLARRALLVVVLLLFAPPVLAQDAYVYVQG